MKKKNVPISFVYSFTYETMNKNVVQSSVTSKTTHNSTHGYISTSKHAIVNAIVSAKFTDNTL